MCLATAQKYRYQEPRLPDDLLDLYVQYKQDTRAIIAWLVGHGPEKYKASQRLSIKDLVIVAAYLCRKAVEMPDVIAFQFRQAISARTRLSRIFRYDIERGQQRIRTEDHEFFTNSLQKMYTELCDCCAHPEEAYFHRERNHSSPADVNGCRYQPLVEDCDDEDDDHREVISTPDSGPSAEETCSKPSQTDEGEYSPVLAEDDLGLSLEAFQLVYELVALMSTINNIWDQAARGQMSLVIAAVLANTAYAMCEDIETRLATSCQIGDAAELYKTCNEANEALHTSKTSDESILSSSHLIQALHDCWQHLLQLKHDSNHNGFIEKISNTSDLRSINLTAGDRSASIDSEYRRLFLRDIILDIQTHRLHNTLTRECTPVYAEVGYLLSHTIEESQGLHGSIGLQMLLECNKTYAFDTAPRSSYSSRLQALKFAQAALPSMRAVLDDRTMPCRCHGTLAFRLENLKDDFEEYVSMKQFDSFFLSPWVCGTHILEMLHALHYYGLRLFAYRRYVGSVIHMYNALRLIADFEEIGVLEDIITTFSDLFFPGGRPGRNFKTAYMRYLGGRLQFHSKQSSHKTGCHELVVPPHTAKATAGFTPNEADHEARFDCGRLSFLFRLKDHGYSIHDKSVAQMLTSPTSPIEKDMARLKFTETGHSPPRPASRASNEEKSAKSRANSSNESNKNSTAAQYTAQTTFPLLQLAPLLIPELTGPFPLARVNMFRIYHICAKIIDQVSDQHHGPDARPGQHCLCCAETLLENADYAVHVGARSGRAGRRGKHKLFTKDVGTLIRILKKVIREDFGGIRREDLLWPGDV